MADVGFASFDLLETSCRLHIVFKTCLHIDAKLYDFPEIPPPGKRGPKPKKGDLLPSLKTLSNDETQDWLSTSLDWYQSGEKKIAYLSGIALWHKTKHDPLPIKWVLVWVEGKKTPQAFFSNYIELEALEILTQYMKRWNVEVTFEEARSHLGIETQRQWSDSAIARTTPVLLGLFSLICLSALPLYRQETLDLAQSSWYQKQEFTFSDLMAAMRRKIWVQKYLNSKNPTNLSYFRKMK